LINNTFTFRTYYLFERVLNETDIGEFMPKENDLSLKIIYEPSELDRLRTEGFDLSFCKDIQHLRNWLSKGIILFCIFAGKELTHMSWLALENDIIIDPFFKKIPRLNAGYIGPCDTSHAYRGLGLYPFVLSQICKFLKENGKSKAMISTSKSNFASVRGITKAGFHVCSEGYHLKLGNWELWNEKNAKR
jgi:hypothetical protein